MYILVTATTTSSKYRNGCGLASRRTLLYSTCLLFSLFLPFLCFFFVSQAETQPLIIFHQAQSTNDEIEAERLTRSPWFIFITGSHHLVHTYVHVQMYCDQTLTKFPVTRLPGSMSNHRWRRSDEGQNPDWGTCGLWVQTARQKHESCMHSSVCCSPGKDSRYRYRRLLVDIASVGPQLLAREG